MRLNGVQAFGLVFVSIFLFFSAPAAAQLFETRATEAYLIEAETGTVLFAKNEDTPVPPASLAKLMSLELAFNALKNGQLSLDDQFSVSENAWRTGGAVSGGSTMFAEIHSAIGLEDLIRGVIVQSANDGSIVIAEGMAGSEENFAYQMTERARAIGMDNSSFGNSTGLPHPDAQVTMRDMALLARHIYVTYPDYYTYFAEPEFTWNGIRQRNRNPLLSYDIGVDGLKTGFTEASGYAIVASIDRDGRRLFLAMSGLESENARREEARKILEWGVRAFKRRPMFAEGEVVAEAGVYGGESTVPLKARGAVDIFLPITNPDRLKARVRYKWPLKAPVVEGDEIGELEIYIGDTLSRREPLYAGQSVGKGPIHTQALDALLELVQFWN
ncbi:D-alanyl-D-alanine carboxypeptidase family protein [Pseudohoeflea coraliihabitans]|uniref:D-alanyl-D-alanine carboxypeptidase family protein n=1 Tax=Pseudohoeflea coraliihabitans TaxID=2860393 RepID=UPI003D177463